MSQTERILMSILEELHSPSRDRLALAAMQGMLANPSTHGALIEDGTMVQLAYHVADKMLTERKAKAKK